MKNYSILVLLAIATLLSACGEKNVSVTDIQDGVTHITNIANSKNASEAIANVAHATNDVTTKLSSSSAK